MDPPSGIRQSHMTSFGRLCCSMNGKVLTRPRCTIFFLIKRDGTNITLLLIHLYDMIIIGSNTNETEILHNYLAKEFDIPYLGNLKYFLVIEVF